MSNQRNRVSIEFDLADLPMLADALRLARNTALISGREKAKERFEALNQTVRNLAPAAAFLFDSQIFFEICAELNRTPNWDIGIKPTIYPWETKGYVIVKVGDKSFCSRRYDHRIDDPEVSDLRDLLEEITPMQAETL